jgi:hypothetical protein
MGVSLLQWNGPAFDSDPAYTLRLLHREDYITEVCPCETGCGIVIHLRK